MEKNVQQSGCGLLSEQECYYKLDNILHSSLEPIRQVFKNRWKSETGYDWTDDIEHRGRFIEEAGRNIYVKAKSFEKSALETGHVAEWDMSLLSKVLQNFGCGKKYKDENAAIDKLRKIRNDLAHSGTKKVTKDEYLKNVEIFKSSLKSLGVEQKTVEQIIELSGVTSSLKALEYMKSLHEKAEQLIVNGKTKEALQCFSESINVPSLLPVNLGTAYEKRAECILSQVKDPLRDQAKCNAALLDTAKAMELNQYSWMAHFLAAQCYRWQNKLSKALFHYERALAISPAQEKLKSEYDICKLLAGEHSRADHFSPEFMPITLEELIANQERKTGIKMSKEDFIRSQIEKGKVIQGQDHVFRGHQYFRGWDVPQQFSEAVKHFAKAATLKNAEGMYNLAVCYQHGHGVKQDLQVALDMYLEVATMNKNSPGDMLLYKCNEGVASAQHALGLLYQEGVGVEQDYVVARFWYMKAMENGVGPAANNLGHLYSRGLGMPQDKKKAEFCWKEAMNLGSSSAPASLMSHYLMHMEPDKAANMLRIGKEMGNSTLLKVSDDELNRLLAQIKSQQLELLPEVLEFEKINKLSSKGLTFKERLTRKVGFQLPSAVKAQKVLDKFLSNYKGEEESWGGKIHHEKLTKENILKAREGSITALNILKTLSTYVDLLVNLSYYYREKSVELAAKIVDLLYNCLIMQFHVIPLNIMVCQDLKPIVRKLFEKMGDTKGEDDMKIRLCYGVFNLSGSWRSEDMLVVQVLKEGVRRYPDNVHYYEYLSQIFGLKRMNDKGRFYAEEGLKRFPEHLDLLFTLGKHLRNESLTNKTTEPRCIPVFKKFIKLAPKDHRSLPDAYYQVSMSLFSRFYFKKQQKPVPVGVLEQIKAYFCLGQDAEKDQLPCYLPYGESDAKCQVENFLCQHEAKLESLPKIVPSVVETRRMKAGVLQRKPYLISPARKNIVLDHRQRMKNVYCMADSNCLKNANVKELLLPPKLKQTAPERLSQAQPIHLQEMNPTQDQIYEDRILELTIMDDVNSFYSFICLIAEDENGDMTRLYVHNFEKSKCTLEKFQPGSKIAILNPYMRFAMMDDIHGIRNDEPKCMVFLQKMEDMCRFCGEKNAPLKCSKCKRPYCSKECQTLDWKELKHKLICSIKWEC